MIPPDLDPAGKQRGGSSKNIDIGDLRADVKKGVNCFRRLLSQKMLKGVGNGETIHIEKSDFKPRFL